MRLIASDDFLYDTVDVAIWSTVEQALAITAGGLATLQPLVKLIGYKLGLNSHPSLPSHSNYGNNIRMKESGAISVRRSFTQKAETASPAHKKYDQMALNLQPGAGEYSAMCYNNANTSQELLAIPTTVSEGESHKEVESLKTTAGRRGSEGIPAAYIPHTHIASAARLSRFRSADDKV
jgi:hypothetical protein